MTLSRLLLVLRARWRSVVLTLFTTLGLVILACAMWPKQYTAVSSVVLDIRTPDPIAGMALSTNSVSNYMATQVDVVMSERVGLKAIRSLRLHESPQLRERWRQLTGGHGEFEPWLAEYLMRALSVRPSRDSNVIAISYTARDAGFAASMANAVMQAYIDTTLELRVEPARQYNSFFDERTKALRDALETAQTKLSDYQQKTGLLATDEKFDVENERLSALTAQMVVLQSLVAESGGRQEQAGANGDRLPEVLNNPLVTALSADVARNEALLEQLTSKYGDSHPEVIQARANIVELRKRMNAATRQVASSMGVTNSVNKTRLAKLQAELDSQRRKVLRLKGQRDEAQVLQRDVETAQRAYEAMTMRLNQSQMESQNTQTNVSVLKRASPPPFPASPRVVMSTAVAAALGLLLGLAAAIVREHLDRRLRTEEEVHELLGQPLLVRLPLAKSARATAPRAPLLTRARHLMLGSSRQEPAAFADTALSH